MLVVVVVVTYYVFSSSCCHFWVLWDHLWSSGLVHRVMIDHHLLQIQGTCPSSVVSKVFHPLFSVLESGFCYSQQTTHLLEQVTIKVFTLVNVDL